MDKLLLVLAEKVVDGQYDSPISYKDPHFIADIAAKDQNELLNLTKFLAKRGWIEGNNGSCCGISLEGWLRIEELQKKQVSSDTAFVAMWFNEEFTGGYREAVIAAVKYCNYRPVILDREEYSDFIMDQVIASIKQARFVIADFTCRKETEAEVDGEIKVKNGVRGGVYWEAGMAYGLNKTVIHTCEENSESRKRIHFDVDQYNTIFWKKDEHELGTEFLHPLDESIENPTFAERLAIRIRNIIGTGTYTPS
jgi:hypothetical protein